MQGITSRTVYVTTEKWPFRNALFSGTWPIFARRFQRKFLFSLCGEPPPHPSQTVAFLLLERRLRFQERGLFGGRKLPESAKQKRGKGIWTAKNLSLIVVGRRNIIYDDLWRFRMSLVKGKAYEWPDLLQRCRTAKPRKVFWGWAWGSAGPRLEGAREVLVALSWAPSQAHPQAPSRAPHLGLALPQAPPGALFGFQGSAPL